MKGSLKYFVGQVKIQHRFRWGHKIQLSWGFTKTVLWWGYWN